MYGCELGKREERRLAELKQRMRQQACSRCVFLLNCGVTCFQFLLNFPLELKSSPFSPELLWVEVFLSQQQNGHQSSYAHILLLKLNMNGHF